MQFFSGRRGQRHWVGAAAAGLVLAACGGGGDGAGGPGVYTVGGVVSGLASGASVILRNNGAGDLTVSANGGFTFASTVAANGDYAVTVAVQPSGQQCAVTQGSGKATANVTQVAVTCGAVQAGPAAGVPTLLGDWLQNTCAPIGNGQSARSLVRATSVNATTINHNQGVVTYANTNCSGTGVVPGVTNFGPVVFSRSETTASIAANWGVWNSVTGVQYVVWAKKSETLLCLLGDQNPSILPTAQNVQAALAVQPDSSCYTRQ